MNNHLHEDSDAMSDVSEYFFQAAASPTDYPSPISASEEEVELEQEYEYENNDPGCYCHTRPRGDMVWCEGETKCPYKWFHLGCLGLSTFPDYDWFCPTCEPLPTTVKEETVEREQGGVDAKAEHGEGNKVAIKAEAEDEDEDVEMKLEGLDVAIKDKYADVALKAEPAEDQTANVEHDFKEAARPRRSERLRTRQLVSYRTPRK